MLHRRLSGIERYDVWPSSRSCTRHFLLEPLKRSWADEIVHGKRGITADTAIVWRASSAHPRSSG